MTQGRVVVFSFAAALWAVVLIPLVESGCAVKAGKDEFQLSEVEQKKLDEMRAETEVGRNMAGRLLAFYGNQESQELLKYVNRVGSYVAGYGDHPERRYMFEILDTEMVNAFACPGGYVLISKGALRHAQTEAELAAILGHEVVHVGNKHMFNKLQSMSSDEMEKSANDAVAAKNVPEELLVRKRPEAVTSDTAAQLARYLQGGSAGFSIMKAARAGMAVMLEQGLGADKEYEADREGVKYSIRAGYDPTAMEDFLCRLQKEKNNEKVTERKCRMNLADAGKTDGKKVKNKTILDKTHPPIPERVKNVRAAMAELNADEIIGAVGKKRFERFQSLMPKKKKEKDSAKGQDS